MEAIDVLQAQFVSMYQVLFNALANLYTLETEGFATVS